MVDLKSYCTIVKTHRDQKSVSGGSAPVRTLRFPGERSPLHYAGLRPQTPCDSGGAAPRTPCHLNAVMAAPQPLTELMEAATAADKAMTPVPSQGLTTCDTSRRRWTPPLRLPPPEIK